MSSMVRRDIISFFFLFFSFLFFLLMKLTLRLSLFHFFYRVPPFQLSLQTVTKGNLILPLAKHVPSVQQASSNNKILTQVFRAWRARQDFPSHLKAPRPAPISAASNPPTARTTSTSTRPFATASVVLSAPPVSVPLILHKSKQNLDGSSVPIILKNLRSVLFQVHALEDPTQHSRINSLMPRKMILLSVPTAQKNVTTSMGMPTAPDFAVSARPTTAWMVSVGSVRNVHPSRKTWRSA